MLANMNGGLINARAIDKKNIIVIRRIWHAYPEMK